MTTIGSIRTRARSLALAALFGAAAIGGTPALSAHALPVDGSGGGKYCYIPGSNFPYLPGEKATFPLNGQPATEHTCKTDGTWTAIRAPQQWVWAPVGGGVLAP